MKLNSMFSTMFFLNARRHLPTKPLPWHEVVSPSIALAQCADANFAIDSKVSAVLNERMKFESSARCHVEEVIEHDLRGPVESEIEAHRQQCVGLIKLKFQELHRANSNLFNRRNDGHAHAVAQREILAGLRAIKFPPKPVIEWNDLVTDAEMKNILGGDSANQVTDKAFDGKIKDFEAQYAAIEKQRVPLTPAEWLSLATTIFFNSCSIGGYCDAHGRQSNDPNIAEFCEEVQVTPASEVYRQCWFKPNATTERHDLFESR